MSWRLQAYLLLDQPCEMLWGQNDHEHRRLSRLMVPKPVQVLSCWEGHCVKTYWQKKW